MPGHVTRRRYHPPRFSLKRNSSRSRSDVRVPVEKEKTEPQNELHKIIKRVLYMSLEERLRCFGLVTVFFAIVSLFITETNAGFLDVMAYSAIYSGWFVFMVPQLIETLNLTLIMQVMSLLAKLFLAELGVLAYAVYRGHTSSSRRVGLKPILEGDGAGVGLGWLGEAGYNLRIATILSCTLVSVLSVILNYWRNDDEPVAPPPPPSPPKASHHHKSRTNTY